MVRVCPLSLVGSALVTVVLLCGDRHAAALSPWKQSADFARSSVALALDAASDVADVANISVARALDAASDVADVARNVARAMDAASEIADAVAPRISIPRGYGRKLVEGATSAVGTLSGKVVGRFLELAGLNSSCAGEAEAGCRQVVAELVKEYLDVTDVSLTPKGLFEALKKRIAVHPGTKWCGAGNVARSELDSGVLATTDACCKRHDECPDNLAVGEERYGLENTCSFTRSHCECDREFHKCLKDAHTLVSLKIGIIYFSILRPQCYEETHPIARCKSRSLLGILPHCREYELDRSGDPIWQWFDNPLF